MFLAAALGGCSPGAEVPSDTAESAGLVTTAPSLVQTPSTSGQPPRDAIARANYENYCAGCHGINLSGGRAHSLFDSEFLQSISDAEMRQTILRGIEDAGMPPMEGVLSDSQILQLLTFIRNESAGFVENPVFVPSPDGYEISSMKQRFRIDVLAGGLDVPWGLAHLPDGRILVTERSGALRIVENGNLLEASVIGIPEVHVGQDAGLFDIAVHPNYQQTGWIYISYAEALPGHSTVVTSDGVPPVRAPSMTVVARGKLSADNEWIEMEVLYRAPAELYSSNGSHYGSRFVFDNAGYLYYSIGDRGDMATAQDLGSPLGKIHRINDDGSVPADNPFVNEEGAIPTIWSYGHRNPQGLAFDPSTGLLWSSEHGPTGGDEINIIEPGKNYGWGVISMGLERGITETSAPGMEQPVVYYTPTLAPSGITFYEGDRYPGWNNSLFVAGLAGQQLRRLEIQGRGVVSQEVLFDQFGRTRTASVGPDGLIYALLQSPTGAGTGLRLSDPTPGILIRLMPLE